MFFSSELDLVEVASEVITLDDGPDGAGRGHRADLPAGRPEIAVR